MAQNINLGSLNVSVGANTEALTTAVGEFKKVATAIRSLSTRISNNTRKIEETFGKAATAAGKLRKETDKAAKSGGNQEKAILKQQKALDGATLKVNNLRAAIVRAGSGDKEVNRVTVALERFKRATRDAAGGSNRLAREQRILTRRLGASRIRLSNFNSTLRARKMQEAAIATANFQNKMRDLTQSIQLALGPLSGVASRVTAFTGLVNKNTIAIAGFIAAIVGIGFVIAKAVKAGSAFESQFKQLGFQLKFIRKEFGLTAIEVNKIAEEIADATLTSGKFARQASSVLITFSQVTARNFERVLKVSQDVVTLLGGDLVTASRRVGRALQDPARGIDALNRQLAILTPGEVLAAKALQEMGMDAEATEFILSRLEQRLGGVSVAAADGLAGAFDTLIEKTARFLEKAASAGGILEPVTKTIRRMSLEIQKFSDDSDSAAEGIEFLGKVVSSLNSAFEAIVNNLSIFKNFFVILIVGGALKKAVKLFGLLAGSIRKAAGAMAFFNIVVSKNPLIAIAVLGATAVAVYREFTSQVNKTISPLERLDARIKILQERVKEDKSTSGFFDSLGLGKLQFFVDKDIAELDKLIRKRDELLKPKDKPPKVSDLTILDPRVIKELRKLGEETFMVTNRFTQTERAIFSFIKTFPELQVKLKATSDGTRDFFVFKLENGKLAIEIMTQIASSIANLDTEQALASKSIRILNDALSVVGQDSPFITERSIIVRAIKVLREGLAAGTEQAVRFSLALDIQKQRLIALDNELFRSSDAFTQHKKDLISAVVIIDETADTYSAVNIPLREYNKELRENQRLLGIMGLTQEQLNIKQKQMEIQLAKNTEGVQLFASTVSSGFARGIVEGEKLRDVIANIGRALVQAALDALIMRAILGGIGSALGGGGVPLANDPSLNVPGPVSGSNLTGGSSVPSRLTAGSSPPSITSARGSNGGTTVININASGADAGVEAKILRAMRVAQTNAVLQTQAIQNDNSRRI